MSEPTTRGDEGRLNEQMRDAVRDYLTYLGGPQRLGTDEWDIIRGRIITLACNLYGTMLNIEALPYLRKALARIAKIQRQRKATR